jgi:GTP-binding protein YchF
MSLNCGIVGLPNVGKSTIFQALTSAPAEAANYPFCTIEPNVGVVEVPDERLEKITGFIKPQKVIPTIVEFVDIAGLVKGASKGEGLGNQFLGNIRQVGAIVHVVRCFEDENIVHVDGDINPIRDIETIETELALADLESVLKRKDKNAKVFKSSDKKAVDLARQLDPIYQKLADTLNQGQPARSLGLTEDEQNAVKDLHLITIKPQVYCCNVDENDLQGENEYVQKVREFAKQNDSEVVVICGKLESEIAGLDTAEEKSEFLQEMGLNESGLDKLIRKGYDLLDLKTYFTAGEKEVRAWTYKDGSTAPQAAGVIHTDFEKGFIKAEIYHCTDLFELESEQKIKELGKLRMEGRDYIVKDGDVVHFRFNV